MWPIKDHKTVLEQQPDPSLNATKVNDIYTPPRKNFIPAVKTTPQLQLLGIFFLKREAKLSIVINNRYHI